MNEIKKLTEAQMEAIARPLPKEAISQNQAKKFLSSIKSIYVTERLNEVFGVGSWRTETEVVDKQGKMVVVKLKFSIPEYGIYYECYGGNDNTDLGDAYKGATTDAITKVASWLGIAAHVFKDSKAEYQQETSKPQVKRQTAASNKQPIPKQAPAQKNRITMDMIDDSAKLDKLLEMFYGRYVKAGYPAGWDVAANLLHSFDADDAVVKRFAALFESYREAMNNSRNYAQ